MLQTELMTIYRTGESFRRFWDYNFELDGIRYVSTNDHGGYFFNFRTDGNGGSFRYTASCEVDEEKWLKYGFITCLKCAGMGLC